MNAAHLARWLVIACLAAGAGLNAAAAGTSSVAWQKLSAEQKKILAPLEHDWATLEPGRRQKWLELAARFPAMPADERARVQERMAEWARLSPTQRTQARMQFQEVRQLPAEERQAKWQAYQALSDDEKRQLAQRASPASKTASAGEPNPLRRPESSKATQPGTQAAAAANGRAVAPIVVQARPGATTTTMSVKAVPPKHVEPAGPKIAATSKFVDPATMLPRRPAATRGTAPPASPASPAPGASEPAADQP